MAQGFFSPKLTLHVGDGFEFMKQNQEAFDVIITDSSDPVGECDFLIYHFHGNFIAGSPKLSSLFLFIGPAESLFKESYYQLMKAALRNGGILCSQGNLVFSVCHRVGFFLKVGLPLKIRIHPLEST